MMVLKRKEIIAAALVVLIGMAGYLNWSYQDTIRVQDGESYIEAGKKLGETTPVNAGASADAAAELKASEAPSESDSPKTAETAGQKNEASQNTDYFENAKIEKQTARAKSLEILNQTATTESFDEEIRKKAQQQILDIASYSEKETAIENIAKAKGYHNICVFMNEDTLNITVKKENFSESDAVKLREIAQEQIKISANNIKVVEIK